VSVNDIRFTDQRVDAGDSYTAEIMSGLFFEANEYSEYRILKDGNVIVPPTLLDVDYASQVEMGFNRDFVWAVDKEAVGSDSILFVFRKRDDATWPGNATEHFLEAHQRAEELKQELALSWLRQ